MDIYNPDEVLAISRVPKLKVDFDKWVLQEEIVTFLEKEIRDENIIIYAALPNMFIHSALIPDIELKEEVIEDLLGWNLNPYSTWGMVYSRENVWIESPLADSGSKTLSNGEQLIYARSFEGHHLRKSYYEVNQKISHVLEIHFVSEHSAWCTLNEFGDIKEIVKIIALDTLQDNDSGIIISMNKADLDKYTCVSDSILCRMFDFTRVEPGSFSGWGGKIEPVDITNKTNIFGRLVVHPGYGSYSRGVQIDKYRMPKQQLIDAQWGRFKPDEKRKFASFIAQDWKNKCITEISCDPACLANYFTESPLPFEITPAFFRPEVLLKYKSDRDKYRLENRSISCRGAWYLDTFDINDAGQVHTYLKYLSHLPYQEQLHWKQYNEQPKAPISKRAFATDFEGRFINEYDPLVSLKQKLMEFHREKVQWWVLRSYEVIEKVNYPYTSSRDEWADEILNLDQLIIEGFEEKWLRRKAEGLKRSPNIKLRSLKLIEECLIGLGFEEEHSYQLLSPFHLVHELRSKLRGHVSGSESTNLFKQAIQEFGNFYKHYEHLCTMCDESIEIIGKVFKENESL